MNPSYFVLPTFLAAVVLAPNDEPERALDTRGVARPAAPQTPASLAWSDVDGDGLPDVLVVRADGGSTALQNLGDGRFEPFPDAVGLGALPPLRSVAWQDHDADGAVDLLYVSLAGELGLLRNEGGVLAPVTHAAGLPVEGVLDAQWADYDADRLADLIVFSADGYVFYNNLGEGRFEARQSVAAVSESPPTTLVLPFPEGDPRALLQVTPPADGGLAVSGRVPPDGPPRLGPGFSVSSSALPPGTGGPPEAFCAPLLTDTSGGGCLAASSVPQLGFLYPLSEDLNVSDSGFVGVGTSAPLAKLHVNTAHSTGLRVNTGVVGATISTTSSTLAALRATGTRAGFFSGRLGAGYNNVFGDHERVGLGFDGNGAGFAELFADTAVSTVRLQAQEVAGDGAQLALSTLAGTETVTIDAEGGSFGADITMRMKNGTKTVSIDAEEATSNGAQIALANANGTNTMILDANTSTGGSQFAMQMVSGVRTVEILSEESAGNGGQITMWNANGTKTMELDANTQATGGSVLDMYDVFGTKTIEIEADETLGDGGQIVLRNNAGVATIVLDANQNGDGYVTTEVLTITGGADLTESFETDRESVEPGSVLVIDPANPGGLRLSEAAYDRRVAGVASGANGVQPGLRLGQADVLDGDTPVALTGRVYVKCTTENGPVAAGDLLTTSSVPGHAMRASDPARSFGAVLGKALSALDEGDGLVLVLVGLQ